MAKTRTYISDQNEVFEGTQAQLCKEKGIKSRKGFSRKSGAVDAKGDRWLDEPTLKSFGGFTKPILYLASIKKYGKTYDRQQEKWMTTSWYEGPSETADIYLHCKDILAGEFGDDLNPEMIPFAHNWVARVEAQYNIIDNNTEDNPYSIRIKAHREAQKVSRIVPSHPKYDRYHKKYLRDYGSISDNLLSSAECKELLNKASRWERDKMREVSQQLAENNYESLHGSVMSDELKAAMRGKLKEYKASK